MAKFITPTEGGKTYELTPAGMYASRCVSFFDLGHQETEWDGVKSLKRLVRIGWEIPELPYTWEDKDTGETKEGVKIVSREYTNSFGEKANLTKDLNSWLGKIPEDFDPEKHLLGKECMINIQHATSKKNGKDYAKITAITPLPKGMKCGDQVNENSFYYMGEEGTTENYPDMTGLDTLPPFVQEKILQSKQANMSTKVDDKKESKTTETAKEVFGDV